MTGSCVLAQGHLAGDRCSRSCFELAERHSKRRTRLAAIDASCCCKRLPVSRAHDRLEYDSGSSLHNVVGQTLTRHPALIEPSKQANVKLRRPKVP